MRRAAGVTRDLAILLLIGAPLVALGGLACYHGAFGSTQDAIDYAQIARNLLEGRGFTSDIALPISLAFPFGRTLPQPILYRPPLPSIALVPFLAAFGSRDAALLAATFMFTLLAGIATYFLGRRVGGANRGRALGLAAAAIVLLNTGLGEEIGNATAEPLATLLVALLFLSAVSGRAFLAGLLFGAILTAKLHIAVILPVLFIPPFLRGIRWRANAVRFAIGALLAFSPWLVRNVIVTGKPVFDLHAFTETQRANWSGPGSSYAAHRRTEATSSGSVLVERPDRLLRYASSLLWSTARHLPRYVGPGIVVLLVFSFFVRPGPAAGRDAHLIAHLAFGMMALGLAPIALTPRYLIVLLPLAAVSGANALLEWLERRPRGAVRVAIAVVLIALVAAPPAARLRGAADGLARGNLGRFWPPATENLRSRTSTDDTIVSDDLSIAWYGRRRVVWVPWDAAGLRTLDEAIPIDAVYLRAEDAELERKLGSQSRHAIAEFIARECEPAGVERDGTGRLFLRRRASGER